MIKDDEISLMRMISISLDVMPMDVAKSLGIPEKRYIYIFDKWNRKDWMDYGVSLRTSWMTDKGKKEMKILLEEHY